jgi:thymidylate kinase
MDNCGKSTIVESLRKNYFTNPKIIVHHSSTPPKGVEDKNKWEFEHYTNLISSFYELSENGYTIILDRFHLGVNVYSKKYRNATAEMFKSIDDIVSNFNPILFTFVDSPENISSRDDGLSLETTRDDYLETRKSFEEAFNVSKINNKQLYDIAFNNENEIYNKVTKYIELKGL